MTLIVLSQSTWPAYYFGEYHRLSEKQTGTRGTECPVIQVARNFP